MNKYQEAFETIKKSLPPKLVEDSRYKTYKAIATIQELISKTNCDDITYCDYQCQRLKQLEKALDIASEQISIGIEGVSACPKGFDCIYDTWQQDRDCKECWHRALLKFADKEIRKGKQNEHKNISK